MIEVKLDEIWVQKHLFTAKTNSRYLKLNRDEKDFIYGALLGRFFQNLKGVLTENPSRKFTSHNGPRSNSETRISAFRVHLNEHPFEITMHEGLVFDAWVVSVIETTIPMGIKEWNQCEKKALPKQVFTSLVEEILKEYEQTLGSTELKNVKEFLETRK